MFAITKLPSARADVTRRAQKCPVLVTGSAGFVGRAAVRALKDRDVRAIRRMVHTTGTDDPATVVADVTDGTGLHRACEGIDTIIHAVSYVGSDENTCWSVNFNGT